ncbi:hypothetical protein SAMN05443287_11728 [Micromonospora phaseoli]|uniref:Uncharacterized protein n=1 Tax=Micromonospora phaseoli TaxID=1144548 RepID=A0A1H7E2G7_9ACTN|nr:hypothetical protein [Micromonospora phaseoli]PZV99179.1 hypothetical protein CLV64_104416 [Micromonospora phaseoli]GIJ80025.1 hypothetical protein Xph01_44570 [Micromonospora phaseoli]SEK04755.1 hypothetical protein SAMN05443287_11728 [Micromonospora phaseoli]
MTGWILLAAVVHRRVSWHRVVGLLAIVIAAVAGRGLPLLVYSAILAGLLSLIAHSDVLVRRAREVTGPPR